MKIQHKAMRDGITLARIVERKPKMSYNNSKKKKVITITSFDGSHHDKHITELDLPVFVSIFDNQITKEQKWDVIKACPNGVTPERYKIKKNGKTWDLRYTWLIQTSRKVFEDKTPPNLISFSSDLFEPDEFVLTIIVSGFSEEANRVYSLALHRLINMDDLGVHLGMDTVRKNAQIIYNNTVKECFRYMYWLESKGAWSKSSLDKMDTKDRWTNDNNEIVLNNGRTISYSP